MSYRFKLCTSHFDDLKAALQHKGIWHLVSMDPKKSARCAQEWLAKESVPPELFDPLAIAVMEINKKATQQLGLKIFHSGIGEACPLCLLNKKYQVEVAKVWNDNITTLLMLTAEKFNLKKGG
jgi:hypothetical protein